MDEQYYEDANLPDEEMNKEYYEDANLPDEEDDEKYMLTPWGCLCGVLIDYGVNVSYISGRVGGHIVDDFMDLMVKCGYIGKVEEDGTYEE